MAFVRSRSPLRRRGRFFLFRWGGGNRRIGGAPKTATRKAESGPPLWRRALRASLRVLGVLAACAALAGAAYGSRYFLYRSPRLALTDIRVTGPRHLRVDDIITRAGVEKGTNLLTIDSAAIEARLLADPWLKQVRVRRELPRTLHIDLVEHQPVALVSLESIYLCDSDGLAFKRATPAEYGDRVVITGIGRAAYVLEPAFARTQIRTALAALDRYQREPSRPPVGEAHIDRFVGVTLYTRKGLALQLGQGDAATLDARLARFDIVWRTLRTAEPRPQMVYLNNRAHPDHITVRYTSPPANLQPPPPVAPAAPPVAAP